MRLPHCNLVDGRENASQKKEGIQRGPREGGLFIKTDMPPAFVGCDLTSSFFFFCLWPSHNRSLQTCRIPGHFHCTKTIILRPFSTSFGHPFLPLTHLRQLDSTRSPTSTSHHLTIQPKKETSHIPQIPPVTPKQPRTDVASPTNPRNRRPTAHLPPSPPTLSASPHAKQSPPTGSPDFSFAPAPQKQQG